MIYASRPENLVTAVETAKSIEAGYKITQKNVQQQSNYALQQVAPSRDDMEVLTVTLKSYYTKERRKSTLSPNQEEASTLDARDAMS